MRAMIPGVLILILWGAVPALAQLPPEILADSYLLKVEQAIGDGDPARAGVEIDKIILLQQEHELDLPDEFHFRYAKAAAAAGLPEQAHEAVVKYLTAAGREGRHYVEALELMNQAQEAIEGRKEKEAASTAPSPPVPAATQDPVEADPEAAGTTEGQKEHEALPSAAGTSDAPPRPGCGQWNTEDFLRTATAETVTACLGAGANVAARDDDRITPLHWAAWDHREFGRYRRPFGSWSRTGSAQQERLNTSAQRSLE